MRWILPLAFLLFLGSCKEEPAPSAANRWADDRLWAVLEAQDHRDTKKLCAWLQDSSATVRAAAATALASAQDSSARPCLLAALNDADRGVRLALGHALSYVADSMALQALMDMAAYEPDSLVRASLHRAGFLADLRLNKRDAQWLIGTLESDDREIRTRAAQQLARMTNANLVAEGASLLHAAAVERDPDVRPFLVGALRSIRTPEAKDAMQAWGARDSLPSVRISAIRALGFRNERELMPYFLERLNDGVPGVRQAAVEQLQRLADQVDGEALWKAAQEHHDESVKFPLYGMVMQRAEESTRLVCRMLLRGLYEVQKDPYLRAALLTARAFDAEEHMPDKDLMDILLGGEHPAVRQAAFEAMSRRIGFRMMMPRAITPDMQVADAAPFWSAVFGSGDPGLICAAAEHLSTSSGRNLEVLFPPAVETNARGPLHPIRDLEALLLLDALAMKRDGSGHVPHAAPPYNHPIDRVRVMALKDGQRYRIHTRKGAIVLAIEPQAAPGSCVAFDSLITAGYYNGKALHRVVPNFVAQGGCPRGDGYGGMPWTLRTETGPARFTTGAVGLASAGRDTESCQFFIMLAPAPHLDGRYTRFAHVVEGMDVVWQLGVGDVMERVERVQ
ncbi:MAG: HEAT repeat domain-containing protein [Flavobacteriales bacterium]|nr:HEAT repeat domain-containing protein [Flavobacteriales bacterium]